MQSNLSSSLRSSPLPRFCDHRLVPGANEPVQRRLLLYIYVLRQVPKTEAASRLIEVDWLKTYKTIIEQSYCGQDCVILRMP